MTTAKAITARELADRLQLNISTFYKHQACGRFEMLEIKPRVGWRRYSPKAVEDYLNREGQPAPQLRAVGRRAR